MANKRIISTYFNEAAVTKKRKDSQAFNSIEELTVNPDFKVRKILSFKLDIDYRIIFKIDVANKIYRQLEKEIKYSLDSKIKIFGKTCDIPRKQVAFGDFGITYTFSGVKVPAQTWHPLVYDLKRIVEGICDCKFNFVLVNRYKDGNDYIGEHRDDEKDLDMNFPIVSLSFGQNRDFTFKHHSSRGSKLKKDISNVKLALEHGSLLVMNPTTNTYWYHSLPKRSVRSCPNPRINLTFRKIKTESPIYSIHPRK